MLAAATLALLAGMFGPAAVAGDALQQTGRPSIDVGMPAGTSIGGEPGFHVLWGVEAVTPGEAFAVGIGGGDLSVRARRWDGERWVPTHPPGGTVSEMYDLVAISRTDVWATGNAQGVALANHWDGTGWTRVPTPPAEPFNTEFLKSVDAAGPNDVWAVGYTELPEGGDYLPLIEHWDGTAWSRIPYRLPYGNTFGLLRGITVVSADDAWAVGQTYGKRSAPLLLHWDGQRWKPVTDIISDSSRNDFISSFRAVDAVAADDVWAVGAGHGPVLAHWDGHVWTRVSSSIRDNPDRALDGLFGVSVVAADDVWAVGGYGDDPSPDRTRILHWNGDRWRRVPSPNPGRANNALYAVSATGPNDAWAVGSYSHNGDDEYHLYMHWDGKTWSRVRPGGGGY